MTTNGMKQTEDRHVACKIDSMVMCNRLDLLALSNCRGEVQLHRLVWQKVWCLSPPNEGSLVREMVWRPDGKVLAVGYSCGTTYLVDVEDKEILRTIKSEKRGSVTCLSWGFKNEDHNSQTHKNYDDASLFLPNPPVTNQNYKKGEENVPDIKRCVVQTQFNILLIGYENGELHMSIFGLFPCGIINVKKVLNSESDVKIVNAHLSSDFTSIQIFIECLEDNFLKLVLFDTEALAVYSDELHSLATKHGQLVQLLSYTDQTMVSIIEAWEQILLEMDSKLEKYASQVPEGGISADFLDLLMSGVPSSELELFLLRDLTAKGLKKFGSSVELSYSTIQKLVLKQLNTVGHDITYHLSELRGLARITHRYQILGIDEDVVTKAILSSSAFINKCLELQQVIDHAMKNYKAFFRWLYTVIVRLMDEHVPLDIIKITQQDLTYIAEFLLNFDKVGVNNSVKDNPSGSGEKKGKFNLERLGQYLIDKNLTITPEDDNPWIEFLNENSCIANHSSVVKSFKQFSLVQQQNHLKDAIHNVFNCSEKSLANQFQLLSIVKCLSCSFTEQSTMNNLRISQINVPEDLSVLAVFTDPISTERGFYFVDVSYKDDTVISKYIYYYFHAIGNLNDSKLEIIEGHRLRVLDVQFYSTEIISILLEHPNDEYVTLFIQFPIKIARNSAKEISICEPQSRNITEEIPKLNAFSVIDLNACKVLDKIPGWRISVSGGRKVAIVLSKACHNVRIFEMENDGDEDDDEILDSTTQSHSTTQHSDTISMNDSTPVNMSVHASDENQSETIDSDATYNL